MPVSIQAVENEGEQEKDEHGGLLVEEGDQSRHENCTSKSGKNEIHGSGPSSAHQIYGQDKEYLRDRQPDVFGCLQIEQSQRHDEQSDVERIIEVCRVARIEDILDDGIVIGVSSL